METEQIRYKHAPVSGLPTSLLARTDQTFEVIALMTRQAGLNRHERRAMQVDETVHAKVAKQVGPGFAKSETRVLTFYMAPGPRFGYFWQIARLQRQGQEKIHPGAFSMALDVQLLGSYCRDWCHLTLDEDELLASCPEWPAIKWRVERWSKQSASALPLGVFMLWPRICDELQRWIALDEQHRRKLGHAVFALSSAGWTDWFIQQALRICPELVPELGHLLAANETQSPDAQNSADPDGQQLMTPSDAVQAQGTVNDWVVVIGRLEKLTIELRDHPTREAITDLAALVSELEAFSETLPCRELPAAALIKSRIRELREYLVALAATNGFQWLEPELLDQIEARWLLAEHRSLDAAGLGQLADDAAHVVARSEAAAEEVAKCLGEIERWDQVLAAADAELARRGTYAEQHAARKKRTDALRQQSDAEAAFQSRQDALIDAASPYSEPFDRGCDYRALAQCADSADALGDTSAPVTLPLDHGVNLPVVARVETQDIAPAATESEAPSAPEESSTAAESAEVFATSLPKLIQSEAPTENAVSEAPIMEVGGGPGEGGGPFGDAAGQACQPIWQLLLGGQTALAYHAAVWIGQVHPSVKAPSSDLLACVALEQALALPDGSVQSALSARFQLLDADDFGSHAPKTWHAALNLLLVAATMRAMVIAPNSDAVSIAAYLHHDGSYPKLYELVQELRDLSPQLMGFRVDPRAIWQARGAAAIQSEMASLQREAEDWLRVQAPAYTIKFAAATEVWRRWLHSGGEIEYLVAAVVHNRIGEAKRVKDKLEALSNHDHIRRLVHDTDRKTLGRRHGEDIHARALETLIRRAEEALQFPRRWLSLIALTGHDGDRLRELLGQVHGALKASRQSVEDELQRTPAHDPWGLIVAGQSRALEAVRSLLHMFESAAEHTAGEMSPAEVLGAPLLRIPDLELADDWTVETSPAEALELLGSWLQQPLDDAAAASSRLARGDILGAELLAQAGRVDREQLAIRSERENWKRQFQKEVKGCRRAIEIGSAYGYLAEAERGEFESRLARWETQIEEIRRFDKAIFEIKAIRDRVNEVREVRAQQVREAMRDIPRTAELETAFNDVEKALGDGDIATANELVHWLVQGRPETTALAPETDADFDEFFPAALQAIESWLEGRRREDVERTIRQGQAILGLEAPRLAGAQLEQAAKMFGAWSDIKSHKRAENARLELLLTGLGLTVRRLSQVERVAGREVWSLDAAPIGDRSLCPVAYFGSAAEGRYRVVCVWERPTEDELLQWVGDSKATRAAILLYFGRMTERKLRELSRLSKNKRRTFALLDEILLFYLCRAKGPRLRTWLDSALPFSYSSPYDATAGLVPPEMFYGRAAELEAVLGLNGRCFIYGGRQLGKTALLKRAEQSFHSTSEGHYAKWVDLRAEGIGVSRTASEVWIALHERLRALGVLDKQIAQPVPGKKQGVEGVIKGIRDFLAANSDRRILLLLDEADRFFEQDGRNDFEETRRLKQLMDETARRFKVVFAGLHNVLRMTERPNHPLAHFGEPIEIGPLREGDEVRQAVDLIRLPMAAAGFAFENRALVIRILAQTNYYPSLIQLYCSHLLRHMLQQVGARERAIGPRYVVTGHDIEQVYSSEALRDEIRAKFRLTLQLDPRYEVVAYAMALDLVKSRYAQREGMPWQLIRQSGAVYWWPDGFRDTSELDFRVLLDEMVGLGVLSRLQGGRYALRNPNVLLLLGNQEEIEAVLVKDREPAIEFESASFRPPLKRSPGSAPRNVFTYQQLSRLLQRANSITVVTGTVAAGITEVAASLEDFLERKGEPAVFGNCFDRLTFGNALGALLAERDKDAVSTVVVPDSAPWTHLWIREAQERLGRLKSGSRFASVLFVADPATLWRLIGDDEAEEDGRPPWTSLLHWHDGYLRNWLEDHQLQLEPEERRHLEQVTGLWPSLLMELAGDCRELRVLRERIATSEERWFATPGKVRQIRAQLGLTVREPTQVLDLLAHLGEAVEVNDLASFGEFTEGHVRNSLRWGELLGLTRSEGAGFWTVDPIAARALIARGEQ